MNLQNQRVAIMAELGFHTRAIASRTGMTESQINSRTALYGIRRRDYRDGNNDASSRVLALAVGKKPVAKSRIFTKDEAAIMAISYDETREKVKQRIAERAKARRTEKKKSKKRAKA